MYIYIQLCTSIHVHLYIYFFIYTYISVCTCISFNSYVCPTLKKMHKARCNGTNKQKLPTWHAYHFITYNENNEGSILRTDWRTEIKLLSWWPRSGTSQHSRFYRGGRGVARVSILTSIVATAEWHEWADLHIIQRIGSGSSQVGGGQSDLNSGCKLKCKCKQFAMCIDVHVYKYINICIYIYTGIYMFIYIHM